MKRSEAWVVLGQLWDEANETQKEALQIAQDDIEFVDLMPNDMVHVVRCKDCKYHKRALVIEGYFICGLLKQTVKDNDFCSFGEKKD